MEKTIKVPRDVHASVKALQYALKHPVVDNNKLRLDTSQKPFLPYKRVRMFIYSIKSQGRALQTPELSGHARRNYVYVH